MSECKICGTENTNWDRTDRIDFERFDCPNCGNGHDVSLTFLATRAVTMGSRERTRLSEALRYYSDNGQPQTIDDRYLEIISEYQSMR
jgi:hypothetical protein